MRAAEGAKRHLESMVDKYSAHITEETFKTVKAVHKYLKAAGYKVSERTIYNHVSEGDLTDKAGLYHRTDVDAYAKNCLTQAEGGYADEKLRAEIKQKHLRSSMLEVELEQKKGKLIDRATVGREFAARIVALRQDLSEVFASLPTLLDGKTAAEQRELLTERQNYILSKYSSKLESVK
jgi:hypothetical protein